MAKDKDESMEIEALLEEGRQFAPPDDFREKATAADEEIFREATADREGFWARMASELEWMQPWTRVLDWKPPHVRWFVDGKLGVWFHWGIPSSIDDGRPHDGSHYGAWMYGTEGQLSASKHPEAVQRLTDWHNKHYGHYSEFGYEDLIPGFKAEKWNPDALVKEMKEIGAHFIMPVACHHDNFDMYDSFHPWNSVDMGPKRDVLKEWKDAATKQGLKFGISTHLYWSPGWWRRSLRWRRQRRRGRASCAGTSVDSGAPAAAPAGDRRRTPEPPGRR